MPNSQQPPCMLTALSHRLSYLAWHTATWRMHPRDLQRVATLQIFHPEPPSQLCAGLYTCNESRASGNCVERQVWLEGLQSAIKMGGQLKEHDYRTYSHHCRGFNCRGGERGGRGGPLVQQPQRQRERQQRRRPGSAGGVEEVHFLLPPPSISYSI